MKIFRRIYTLILLLFFFSQTNAQITYEEAFPNLEFEFPLEIQTPEDGTDRMFVVEQPGRIKVFLRDPDVSIVNTFLDITDRVYYSVGQEIGLLGLAFHPDFVNNDYLYVYYTAISPIPGISTRMVLSRFTVDTGNSNLADPMSELILFQFDKNYDSSNHNGGKIAFGPDGYLYISFGDGGGGNDPQGNGQNKETVFSSICRIDVDIDGSNPIETNPILPDGNYEIPSDNPFVGVDGLDEIFAYGLRNTWKFCFDNPTGRLWGADVGQLDFEEINLIENGKNYGWSRFEATTIVNSDVIITETTTFPIFFYDHLQGDKSITGGYVYRGAGITSLSPDINSKYIYGDFITGRVWALNYNGSTGTATSELLFQTNGEFISSFGLDQDGEIYFSDYGTNAKIFKLVDGTTSPGGTAINGVGIWRSLDEGVINGQVQAIATSADGNIYHAGAFNQVGTITANNIAVWNEITGWDTLGAGSNGSINDLKIASNGNLYAGGSFTEIDGVSAKNIALWNGTTWSALGAGIDGSVLALEIDSSDNLYAAGVFEIASGITSRNIVLWDGLTWSALTDTSNSVPGTNNEIRSLDIDDTGILYVGGNFDEAGGNSANRIATWDGANWGTLGSGTSGFVQAICSTPTEIYIGGNFATAGGQTVNRIARWNKASSNWNSLGNGVSNNINTLLHDGTYLYAAGTFDLAFTGSNTVIVNNIARYSTTNNWEALGPDIQVGVDIMVNDMAFSLGSNGIDEIFVGGNFSIAGNLNTSNAASWLSDNLLTDTDFETYKDLAFYPNPTNGMLYLSETYDWTLSNTYGQIIVTGQSNSVNLYNYSKGIYFLKIKNKSTIKIIKQ